MRMLSLTAVLVALAAIALSPCAALAGLSPGEDKAPRVTAGGNSPRELMEKIRLAAAQEVSGPIRLEVETLSLRETPGPGVQMRVVSPHPPLGAVSVEAIWTEHGQARKTFGTVVLRAYAKVAVVKTPVRHGEALTQANIAFEKREISAHSETGYYLDWENVSKLRAQGHLRPGMVLGTMNTLGSAPITRNEMVDLIQKRGSLRVVARVRALDEGQLHQWIRVENPSSRKVLQAKVTGPGEVQLR